MAVLHWLTIDQTYIHVGHALIIQQGLPSHIRLSGSHYLRHLGGGQTIPLGDSNLKTPLHPL
jgi:hypothetical protein